MSEQCILLVEGLTEVDRRELLSDSIYLQQQLLSFCVDGPGKGVSKG